MAKSENLTIMFTDIAGFSELVSTMSRKENEEMMRRHDAVLGRMLKIFKGRHVKSIGDSFLIVFRSPTDAALCAMSMHDALWEMSSALPEKEKITIRVALNLGEVRLTRNDVYGEAVNIAARLESVTPAGEVYLTEAVYLSMNKAEVGAEYVDTQKFKGCPEPTRFYKVPKGIQRVTVPDVVETSDGDEADDYQYPFGGVHLGKADSLQQINSAVGKVTGSIHQAKNSISSKITSLFGSIKGSVNVKENDKLNALLQKAKNPKSLIAIGVCCAAILLGAYFISRPAVDSSPVDVAETLPQDSEAIVTDPQVLPEDISIKLKEIIDSEDKEALSKAVDGYAATYPQNHYLKTLQGNSFFEASKYEEALGAYFFALEGDTSYLDDSILSKNMVSMIGTPQADKVVGFLEQNTSENIISSLSKMTGSAGLEKRYKAIDLLKTHKRKPDIDYVGLRFWDAVEAKSCDDRANAASKLVSYKSSYAKKMLERLSARVDKAKESGKPLSCVEKVIAQLTQESAPQTKEAKKTWLEKVLSTKPSAIDEDENEEVQGD